MKRYLAFYGDVFYPQRGMKDFIGSFNEKQSAIDAIVKNNNLEDGGCFEYNYGSVYDTKIMTEVYKK